MFNDEIVERCPELFIEIIRFIPDINGMDLLSFMLVNKKWLNLIDNYSNQLVYKLLSQDRLDKEYFETLTNNNNKEIFIDCVLNFWSEYLQTNEPFQQLPELKCGDVINKCKGNMCWLSLDNKTMKHTDKYTYRHIRSRKPITKDITMYFYIKHLKKEVDNSNSQCLLFGIMNEGVITVLLENNVIQIILVESPIAIAVMNITKD